jgi:predicted ATPase/DNA-binding CsgD family transcriptional regulator
MNQHNKIIGREREKAELKKFIDSTRNGNGHLVLIAGDAGIGKTLLAEEMLSPSGLSVYNGRSSEGVTPPYGPITAILRDFLRRTNLKQIDCGPLTAYLSSLLPELDTPQHNPDAETLVETILSALGFVAKRSPSVLFLDDLHWADNATLHTLPVLAERFGNMPLLILGTYRSDEIPRGHQLRRMRNELRRRRLLQEITLEPLNPVETALLIERVIAAPPAQSLVDIIYEKTFGVPLFVEELAGVLFARNLLRNSEEGHALQEGEHIPIPESIRDAVLLRLDSLSDNARAVLEVAAVAGIEFDFDLPTKIAGSDDALTELIEHNWIVEVSSGRGTFRHGLMREAIYHEVIWSRRRLLHRHIAEYLETAGTPPEQTAEHWLAANEVHKARKALLVTAERSCELHAYRDAARVAHRALENWNEGEDEELRIQTLERLAQCAQLSGQLSDAAKTLRELLESPLVKQKTSRFAEAQRSLATVYGLQGAWEQYLAARIAAADAFEAAGMYGEAATELLSAATRNYGMGNVQTSIDLCDKSLECAVRAERYDLRARALALKGNALTALGIQDEGIGTVHEGLSIALQYNLPDAASDAYKRLADSLETASDFTGAGKAYHSAYNYCISQGNDALAQLCLGCMAYVLLRTGDWKQCTELCQTVINDSKSFPASIAIAYCVLAFVQTYRGTLKQARKNMRKSMEIARSINIESIIMSCIEGFALMDEYEGRDSSVVKHYSDFMALREKLKDDHYALAALLKAVTFFATRNMEREAVLSAKTLAEMAKQSGNIENLGTLAYALGETSLMHNDPHEAILQLEQASEHFEKLEIPIERLMAEWRLGIAYHRTGDRANASAHLRGAYQIARNLGCRPLASQIAEELDALGESPEEQRSPDGESRAAYGGLTRRQIEILRFVTEGLTNKEIASKLYLSPRTVEMHVANILDRLNCRSRVEAVRKAEEMGVGYNRDAKVLMRLKE